MLYVCNVSDESAEAPLEIPTWTLQTNAAKRAGFRRRDGQDVIGDGHGDTNQTPGDPGLSPVGKPSFAGSPNVVGDHYESPEEPLVLPRMPIAPKGQLGDLKGSQPRTVADILAAQADISADGAEPDGSAAGVWPQELFQKRKGR